MEENKCIILFQDNKPYFNFACLYGYLNLILEFSTVISLLPTTQSEQIWNPVWSRSTVENHWFRGSSAPPSCEPWQSSHPVQLSVQTVVCQSCFNGILSQHYKGQRTRSVTEQHHLKYRNSRSNIFYTQFIVLTGAENIMQVNITQT